MMAKGNLEQNHMYVSRQIRINESNRLAVFSGSSESLRGSRQKDSGTPFTCRVKWARQDLKGIGDNGTPAQFGTIERRQSQAY